MKNYLFAYLIDLICGFAFFGLVILKLLCHSIRFHFEPLINNCLIEIFESKLFILIVIFTFLMQLPIVNININKTVVKHLLTHSMSQNPSFGFRINFN